MTAWLAPVRGGGFFDADLEILFEGGALGNWQIPAFDCAVTGGPAWLASGGGPLRRPSDDHGALTRR